MAATWIRNIAISCLLSICCLAYLLPQKVLAAGVGDLSGFWTMVHDDWRGTLQINPSDQLRYARDGSCTYRYYAIDGWYTRGDGVRRWMRGTFGGRDTNRRDGAPCPQTAHLIRFTVDFGNGGPAQPFEGYLFTRQGRTMSGYTWWQGTPFGWFATKQ